MKIRIWDKMLDFNLAFPHSYEIEEVAEHPGDGNFRAPVIYVPPPTKRPEHTGLWLRLRGKGGKPWIGVFAYGYTSPPAFSRVISSPDPDRVCVVANGSAYIVKVDAPEVWEQVPIIPVLDVRLLLEKKLLVFGDFIRLAAYGTNGFAWRSSRVCWDGLRITNVTSELIEGVGYDPTNAATHESRFAIELRTGRSLLPSSSSMPD